MQMLVASWKNGKKQRESNQPKIMLKATTVSSIHSSAMIMKLDLSVFNVRKSDQQLTGSREKKGTLKCCMTFSISRFRPSTNWYIGHD